ncbi:hypothetical protein B0A54_16774 [Friedmanniomyces endolithicus]|uniref:Uncharacterized protein n=1 Tax=Friedmanniomyces endolithicus TaxID=329885 RepID=A0A4U0TYR0_9PEZI|nr:hypothetical protein B0A54_16774 [Friedmanniomyces endolithicus]
MSRPSNAGPQVPSTNGHHKGKSTKSNKDTSGGASGGGGGGNGGSGGGNGGSGPYIFGTNIPVEKGKYWFCCNMTCQDQVTWNYTAACHRCGHGRCTQCIAGVLGSGPTR